jgi:hypothetical protein
MARWASVAEVAREFGLQQHESDLSALRDGLKKIVSSVHPDKNGGVFRSEQDKDTLLRTQSALEYIEAQSQSDQALIPLSQLPAIVSAVSQALASRPATDSQVLRAGYMADAKARISRRYVLPKVSSGVFAAITGFLVAFPDKFANHPILGPFLAERLTQLGLLAMVFYSGVFFVMAWFRERRTEAHAEYLMSERALVHLFDIITHHASQGDTGRVSSRHIMDAVQNMAGYRPHSHILLSSMLLGSRVDLQTLENAASIQTQRLVERRLLSRVDVAAIDAWYDVRKDAGRSYKTVPTSTAPPDA